MAQPKAYRRIVIACVVALTVIAVVAIVARRTFLRYEFALVTYVDDSAGITPSSPVLLHGISIGHVRRVSLSGSKEPNRVVRIDMLFSRNHLSQIPGDSTIAITASNLLGDKSLDISRGVHSRQIKPDSEIPSTATQDINSVLDRGKLPLRQVDSIIERVDRILEAVNQGSGTVGLLVNDKSFPTRINGITAGLAEIQASVKTGKGALLHVTELETEAQKPLARMNDIVTYADHGKGTFGLLMHDPNSPTLSGEATATMDQARRVYNDAVKDKKFDELMKQVKLTGDKSTALMKSIESGKGTAGLFLSSSQISDSVKGVEAEWDSFVADFSKHPRSFVALRLF
jgi:hypothetical protein